MSSSGHLALVPRLLGCRYAELPADERKTFEVALHAGSAPALALALRGESLREPRLLALTLLPPALAGLLLERPVQERLGGPRSVAIAQTLAGLALLGAGRAPQRRSRAGALDHLAVGFAQALALVPGVSRAGAALTAGRLRGLSAEAAVALSLRAALPVTLGATVLKGARLLRDGVEPGAALPLAAGAAAACASGLAALPLARRRRWEAVAAYRIALGVALLLHDSAERRTSRPS